VSAPPPTPLRRLQAAFTGGRIGARWPHLLAALLLVTLLGVMLATFRDYGISTDEGVQHRYGRRIVRWYATLGAADDAAHVNDLYLYGGFFELCAQGATALLPLGSFDARHLANALFGLLGVVAAWGIGSRVGGPRAGLLSALFLALTPCFYGNSFANPKDVPFASLFALAVWVALGAGERVRRLGWREAGLMGLVIGLAAGVRVAGIVLYGAVAALWLGCWWLARRQGDSRGSPARGLARVLSAVAGAVVVGWVVMVAFWPWAQLDPVRNPIRAFRRFSNFWPGASVFFDGRLLLSGELPRDYMPRSFALALPEFYALAFLLGTLAVVSWLRRRRPGAGSGMRAVQTLWLAAMATAPIIWVVLRRTPVYNGVRHLMFVVPLLAVLAGLSVTAWFDGQRSRLARLAAAAGLAVCLAVTLVDMVQLHPYQHVYFNRLFAGGLPRAAQFYETDYLCASYKEGIEWMASEYLPSHRREIVRVDGNCSHVPFWYYLGRGAVETTNVEPNLMFVTTSFGDHRQTEGRVVHVVQRQGTPLLYIFEQRSPR
jgi:Dolichyl-phosphate-mannose-protein mannosyltransferase